MPRRGLVVAREEEVVVALPRNKHLRFPTPTKPPALPSEILLFLFAKKSTAAQLTYNRTMGEWASTDRAALPRTDLQEAAGILHSNPMP